MRLTVVKGAMPSKRSAHSQHRQLRSAQDVQEADMQNGDLQVDNDQNGMLRDSAWRSM